MDPDHDLLGRIDDALNQGHMFKIIHLIEINDSIEFTVHGGQTNLNGPVDQGVLAHPVGNQVGDSGNFKVVLKRELM